MSITYTIRQKIFIFSLSFASTKHILCTININKNHIINLSLPFSLLKQFSFKYYLTSKRRKKKKQNEPLTICQSYPPELSPGTRADQAKALFESPSRSLQLRRAGGRSRCGLGEVSCTLFDISPSAHRVCDLVCLGEERKMTMIGLC